jgi:diphthine synthase
MALILVGAGIAYDLTISGVEALRDCDEVYVEQYTNPVDESKIEEIELKVGKKIILLEREKVESAFLVEKAKDSDICLISSGDPLTATTHISLVLESRQKGIPVRIIHNSSIYSAAPARAGLQIYRFGKTASLVNPRPNYAPTSSLEIIRKNLSMDMHSLILLDTEPEPMEAETALEMLFEFDKAVVLSRLGEGNEKITYGIISDLLGKDLGRVPFCIIIPAKLHAMEEEFLALLSK